jgi:hypothetical protein
MEGTSTKQALMGLAARSACALVTIGALAFGLAACGSGSSSSTAASSGSVVKKEAGVLTSDVEFTVTNNLPRMPADYEPGDWFWLCFSRQPAGCQTGVADEHEPAPGGGSVTTTGYHVGGQNGTKVTGQLQYPIGYSYYAFTVENPDLKAPFIELQQYTTVPAGCGNHLEDGRCLVNTKKVPLSEGESHDETMNGDKFTFARASNTSNVRLSLAAFGGGSLP